MPPPTHDGHPAPLAIWPSFGGPASSCELTRSGLRALHSRAEVATFLQAEFRDWEGPALVRLLYYLLLVSTVMFGLGKWIDVVADASAEEKSMLFAMFRGCLRFLFWSTVGVVTSRLFCELLLSAYIVRDALYQKLRVPEGVSPLVKPVGQVADGGHAAEGGGYAIGSTSGYQTVQ